MTAVLENFDYIAFVLALCASCFVSLRFVHMLQLESYQGPMYFRWLKKNGMKDYLPLALIFLICLLLDGALLFVSRSMGSPAAGGGLHRRAGRHPIAVLCAHGVCGRYVEASAAKKAAGFYQARQAPHGGGGRGVRHPFGLFAVCDGVRRGLAAVYLLLRMGLYLPALLMPFVVGLAYLITLPVEEGIKRPLLQRRQAHPRRAEGPH